MPGTVTAFADSPDRGRGLARDFRVRWTLEELGETCDVRLVAFAELKTPDCGSAWKKDPAEGVIGVQTGPLW
jgi:hypothetical protein